MLESVKGIYDNGVITLEEKITASKAKVVVTVIEEIDEKAKPIQFGSLRGQIIISDDFDAPLDEFKDYI